MKGRKYSGAIGRRNGVLTPGVRCDISSRRQISILWRSYMLGVRVALAAAGVGLLMCAGGAGATQWKEPKDGVFTEKQLTDYLSIQKEAIDNWKAAGKAVDGASSAAALAVALKT